MNTKFYATLFFLIGWISSHVVFGQTFYRTKASGSGNWNNASSWQVSYDEGITWADATDYPGDLDGFIFIGSEDGSRKFTLTIPRDFNISTYHCAVYPGSKMIIQANATLDLIYNEDPYFPELFVDQGGLVEVNGTIRANNRTSTVTMAIGFIFHPNSLYHHNQINIGGSFPFGTWEENSNVLVTGFSSISSFFQPPSNLNQEFYNFTWDTPNLNRTLDLRGGLYKVKGDFYINGTGSNLLNFSNTARHDLIVEGNLIINNDSRINFSGSPTGTSTLTVNGNFTHNSSQAVNFTEGSNFNLDIAGDFSQTSTGGTNLISGTGITGKLITFNIGGDINITSGNFSTNSGTANIIFDKTGTQTFSSASSISGPINYTVKGSSELNLGTSALQGTGNFNIESGAGLILGSTHPNGALQPAGTNEGNIQVIGIRTFADDISITYNGTSAQSMGTGYPQDKRVMLTIDNAAGASLSEAITIFEGKTLNLQQGSLQLNGHQLTMNGGSTLHMEGSSSLNGSSLVAGGAYLLYYKNIGSRSPGIEMVPTQLASLTIDGGELQLQAPVSMQNSLNILSGSTLAAGEHQLRLGGNWLNNGTFRKAAGQKVVFEGTAAKTISGSSTTEFYDLDILAGSLTVNSAASLFNMLDIEGSGSLAIASDVDFTLRSTSATHAAAIAEVPAGSISGEMVVQRYVPNQEMFRYIASPVATTLGDWRDDIWIQGEFLNPNWEASMWHYSNDSWVDYPGSTGGDYSPIERGKGYHLFFWEEDAALTINSKGSIDTGDFPFNLTSSSNSEWHLLGNPYPAAINWISNGWERTGVTTAYIPFTPGEVESIDFITISNETGITTNGTDNNISSGQAFWVYATSGASLKATESVKVNSNSPNGTPFYREKQISDVLLATLSNGKRSDQMVVAFRDHGTDNFDPLYDSPKRMNTAGINLYSTTADDKAVAQNITSRFDCIKEIPLVIGQAPVGSYSFRFEHMESMSREMEIVLEDKLEGTSFSVAADEAYTFTITEEAASYENRFRLVFSEAKIAQITAANFRGGCEAEASVQLKGTEDGVYYQLFDANEMEMSEAILAKTSNIAIPLLASQLNNGSNSLSVKAFRKGCVMVAMDATLEFEYSEVPAITSVNNSNNCKGESATLSATASLDNASFKWYTNADAEEAVYESTATSFTTPVLNQSATYYVAGASEAGCESERVAVTATVNNMEIPAIAFEEEKLVSSYTSGNQWLLNGEPIAGATEQEYIPQEDGEYSVMVKYKGCSSLSEAVTFRLTGIKDEIFKAANLFNPNPARNFIYLNGSTFKDSISAIHYSIFTTSGTLVARGTVNSAENAVSVENLKKGLYLIQVQQGEKRYFSKLLKH